MAEWTAFKFLTPGWLAMLPLAWLIAWLFSRYSQQLSMWDKICDSHLLERLIPGSVKVKNSKWLSWVLAMLLSLAVIAAAGPSWRNQPIPLFESAEARVIVLDLSRSMLAQDVKPTRFKRAIFKAKDLVTAHQDGQTALVAFAGAAFVVSPLTDDKNTLLNFLDALNPDIMPVQGSRIDLAITVAQRILKAAVSQTGQIYVLTDGVSELQAAIHQATETQKAGNRVSILAFGTKEGGPLKDGTGRLARDGQGQLIIARVGFEDLQQIAQAGGGKFIKMTASDQDVQYLLTGFEVPGVDQSQDSEDQSLKLPVNDGAWLVWLMLPLALLLFRKNTFWIVVVMVINPLEQNAYAFEWSSLWKNKEQRAYESYQQGDYPNAHQLSNDPQLKGSAFYKDQDYKNAESWFAQQGSATSFYNRGNALAHQQNFQLALAAYSKALELKPDFVKAQQNKALIEEFLKQQQQQQQDQQNPDDQGDEASDETSDKSESDESESEQAQSPRSSRDDDLQADSTEEQIQQQNQVDPRDERNPTDELALQEQVQQQTQNPESIDRWINRLPDDPSELLRRKFLRDYQRQRGTP